MFIILYLLIFSFLILKISNAFFIHPKLDLIQNFRIVNVNIDFFERNGAEEVRIRGPVSVRFQAYEKNFHLLLQKDHSILSPSTKIFIVANTTTKMNLGNIQESFIYNGTVKGEDQSIVSGYFNKNMFIGRIELKEEIYFLEMASLHLKQEAYKDKVMIYKQTDILPPGCKLKNGKRICKKEMMDDLVNIETMNISYFDNNANIEGDSMKIENQLTCNLELLADHTFVEFMKNNDKNIIGEMLYHIKVTDRIFRYTDLDNDLIPEGIGFSVEKITIIKDKSRSDYPLNFIDSDSSKYLNTFAKHYKHDLCMAVAFSHRDFAGGVIGKAYLRGVCGRASFPNSLNLNVNIVTNLNHGRVLPRLMISIVLTHEIGHTFGSPHDKPGDVTCAPGDINTSLGNYIMYPVATDGLLSNNWIFSPCSKQELKETIYSIKGSCLKKTSKSVCGNGITEIGEECDCGKRENCQTTDKCCNPPGSPAGCTLKKHTATFCSPREADCCNEECEIILKEKNHKCFSHIPCQLDTSVCDGTSPYCPIIPLADGSPCLGSAGTCLLGSCKSNVCKDNGLEPCECSSSDEECHICCRDESRKCRSTKSLRILRQNRKLYIKIPGTRCYGNKGICSSNGTCILGKLYRSSEDPFNSRRWRAFWPFFLPLPLLTLFIFIILISQQIWKNSFTEK